MTRQTQTGFPGKRTWRWMGGVVISGLMACAPASLVDVATPNGVVVPSAVYTPSGAVQLANYAIGNFSVVYAGSTGNICGPYSYVSGILTDELMGGDRGYDNRVFNLPIGTLCPGGTFGLVNQPRVEARQAREGLALYTPGSAPLQGLMADLEAYTIIQLAEFFCSGVPLSTVTLAGTATPSAGIGTADLFARAIALFDSAAVLGHDSAAVVTLAQVGKGRALLGQGKLAEAAQAVSGVPTQFIYTLTYTTNSPNFIGNKPSKVYTRDQEGTNGLLWSADPRTAIMTAPAVSSGMPISAKYSKTAAGVLDATSAVPGNPVWLASGVEARLIEAEADLAAGGSNWLTILNTLRSTCIGTAACAPVPGLTVASLPPLADPGTADTRLNLLMKERAMWLFLTGHRQGDLRRLAHLYHRDRETVWPTGVYVSPGFPPLIPADPNNGSLYGVDVVAIIENFHQETAGNPLFTGCENQDP